MSISVIAVNPLSAVRSGRLDDNAVAAIIASGNFNEYFFRKRDVREAPAVIRKLLN